MGNCEDIPRWNVDREITCEIFHWLQRSVFISFSGSMSELHSSFDYDDAGHLVSMWNQFFPTNVSLLQHNRQWLSHRKVKARSSTVPLWAAAQFHISVCRWVTSHDLLYLQMFDWKISSYGVSCAWELLFLPICTLVFINYCAIQTNFFIFLIRKLHCRGELGWGSVD